MMRVPVKLNRGRWPATLARLLRAVDDPRVLARRDVAALSAAEFAQAVSVLKFGATFKSTCPGRQPIADRLVADRFAGARPVILDIGASDGSTSLDLIRRLGTGFSRCYVTDFNICVEVAVGGSGVFFRAGDGEPILTAGERLVFYADTSGAPRPLAWLSRRALARAKRLTSWSEVKLIQPELQRLAATDPRVVIERHDMMQPWRGEAPDLIKMANLLNEAYFSPDQMRAALRCQCAGLREDGCLLLVDNRDDLEQVSLLRRRGDAMVLVEQVNGGADAAKYACRALPLPPNP